MAFTSCDIQYLNENISVYILLYWYIGFSLTEGEAAISCLEVLFRRPSLDWTVFNSYWPVSSFLFLGKVIEKVLSPKYMRILKDYLAPFQLDFRPGYSAEAALVVLSLVVDGLCQSWDRGGNPSLWSLISQCLLIPLSIVSFWASSVGWSLGTPFYGGSLPFSVVHSSQC